MKKVIHAGLYYGPSSLKTHLCIRGKQLLYDFCSSRDIPHRRTTKWIVAQTDTEWEECLRLHDFAETLNDNPSFAHQPSTHHDNTIPIPGPVPTRLLSPSTTKEIEPSVRASCGVLESLSTGIIDSHALMTCLQSDFEDHGGDSVLNSTVTRIDSLEGGTRGYRIFVRDRASGIESSIVSSTLINSAGLGAVEISNMILPRERRRKAYFAKGTYFGYSPDSSSSSSSSVTNGNSKNTTRIQNPRRLIYPVPRPDLAGLGTHLTFDLQGRLRFGPDVEWVDDPTDLIPRDTRLMEAVEEIQRYLPGVRGEDLTTDYCGIRPKLGRGGSVAVSRSPSPKEENGKKEKDGVKGFQDFVIQKEDGYEGFVNLLGIESPGLTSCLAIGEMVEGLLYE
ncbi:MAG: hypothetical protein M1823_001519 [Watsoniomyces obsoletus]|nr:MAG: hypothetical protein M1823_001519 [Watsoniomyces obsoletus]